MRNEWLKRTSLLQQSLSELDIDGCLIMDRVSLYYYFGTIPGGTGFIPVQGQPVLFVRRGLERALRESFFEVRAYRSFRDMVPLLIEKQWLVRGTIGLEFDRISLSLSHLLKKSLGAVEFIDMSPVLRKQRAVKTDFELELLRQAGIRAGRSFEKLPDIILAPGNTTELAAMSELEAVMRREGHQGIVRLHAFNGEIYYGAFSSGDSANAAIAFDGPVGTPGLAPAVPFLCSTKKIERNEPIMVDVVFGYNGYLVDQTRIFAIGSLPSQLMDAHAIALEIQKKVVANLKPGVPAADLYELAMTIAQKNNVQDHFMGSAANRVTFIGHGVGLELDEIPVLAAGSKDNLLHNMVIALEPKFFFKGIGGVGTENTFRVTEQGGERLTPLSDEIVFL